MQGPLNNAFQSKLGTNTRARESRPTGTNTNGTKAANLIASFKMSQVEPEGEKIHVAELSLEAIRAAIKLNRQTPNTQT